MKIIKKGVICILVCMLVMVTMTSIIEAYPKHNIGENNFIRNAKSPSSYDNEVWMKTYGGWRVDDGASVELTADGGYIVVGRTLSYGAGNYNIWMIKTDSDGNKTWDKTFGGKYSDWSYSVQQTDDGGFIITGIKDNNFGNTGDIWLIKTDENGNEVWNKTFDYGIVESGNSVIQTSDGGYIILGDAFNATSSPELYTCVYLIKTDSNGNMIWDKKFEGKTTNFGSIVETPDHYYVGVGSCNWDVWVFKTDSNGELVWERTYGGNKVDDGLSLVLTNDENYLVVGYTKSYGAGGSDIWLLKIDSAGDLKQNITIGGKYSNEAGYSIKTTNDGGYVIAGVKSWSFFRWHRSDGLLVKLDSDLTTEWTKTFGGFGNDGFLSVQQITDNSYILAGFTTKFLNENVWLVNTN
jgi:predicted secreted protein